jgi:hypothetical protein
VKRTSAPKIELGFHSACSDLNPQKRFYAYPGAERFPLDDKTDAIGVAKLAKELELAKYGPSPNPKIAAAMSRRAESARLDSDGA